MVNRLDVHTYIYFELPSLRIYRHLELNIKPLTTSNGRPTQYAATWPEVKHGRVGTFEKLIFCFFLL